MKMNRKAFAATGRSLMVLAMLLAGCRTVPSSLPEGEVDPVSKLPQEVAATAAQGTEPATVEPSPAFDIHASTPEEQGFNSAKLAEGLLAMKKRGLAIHSLTVVRNDTIVLDAYFYPYDGTLYHDLASVTKSVLTTLVGIAVDKGFLDLDKPVVAYFPDRKIANRDELKERITIRHLASMSSGLDCTYGNEEKTLQEMVANPDWVQFVLDLPVVAEPGTRFVYCSPGMHLLSAVLQAATGMPALEYARQNLFEPLGIREVYWPADPQGVTYGWGDLSLKPPDMARLGVLFLHQGLWGERQILSADWVAGATVRQMPALAYKDEDYGYGWWVSRDPKGPHYFRADGNGGQRILVVPEWDLVVAATGGGYSFAEILPYLTTSATDSWKPLPANPQGEVELAAALETIHQGPAPKTVPPLPAIAGAVSGQIYVFESDLIRSVRVDFDTTEEAIVELDLVGEGGPRIMVAGLDGVYRPSRGGRPIVARARWANETTLVIEVNEGPGFHQYSFQLTFQGDYVMLEVIGKSFTGKQVEQ
jgi:CubicO group peptidase (beta-lactamase class C family)